MEKHTIDKQTLRKQFMAARQAIDTTMASRAAQAVAMHLIETIPTHVLVAGYAPIRAELDIFPALELLAHKGRDTALPTTVDQQLVFRAWRPGEPLARGKYNIREPLPSAIEVTPAIVLVPLVAFDDKGHRLGYGAGYYDRLIARTREQKKPVQFIGVAYSQQRAPRIPAEAHDERLDAVVTEKGLVALT